MLLSVLTVHVSFFCRGRGLYLLTLCSRCHPVDLSSTGEACTASGATSPLEVEPIKIGSWLWKCGRVSVTGITVLFPVSCGSVSQISLFATDSRIMDWLVRVSKDLGKAVYCTNSLTDFVPGS